MISGLLQMLMYHFAPAPRLSTGRSNMLQYELLVAIKVLHTNNEKEYRNERDILLQLRSHPHLIKLLASFHYHGKWHLILPYADADLKKYWEDRPKPKFDQKTVLWSVKQMHGIAGGLLRVHNHKPTHPLELEGGIRKQRDANLSVQPGEEKYGRHGDFKPENILWFSSGPEIRDENGILKIADFGLGRFHGRDSRSQSDPHSTAHTQTYEPPELRLGIAVSRAYDFWSLGCVNLEFVTWLLRGYDGIDDFSYERLGAHNSIRSLTEDIFFTMNASGDDAEVRPGVLRWVEGLHQHERCSNLIHDLLDLIMGEMLCIDPKARIEAGDLSKRMQELVHRAEKDHEYLLTPTPRKPENHPQASTTSSGGKHVRFA